MTNWLTASTVPLSPAEPPPLSAVWGPVAALAAAMLVQGAAGRPAPPSFRLEIEGVVMLLLLAAVGWRRPLALALGGGGIGGVCLLILLWVPLLRGAAAGWPFADVLRDAAPLLFLFLPLVLVPALRPAGRLGAWALAAALMLEGLFYVLRWWNHAGWGFGALGVRVMADGGGYLLNAPSVLFAAVAWPLAALHLVDRQRTKHYGGWGGWAAAAFALPAGGACVAALLGAAHRMAVGLIALTAIVVIWAWARRLPWLLPLLAVAALVAVGLEGERLGGALFHVAEKTRLTGGNARIEEAAAALTQAGATASSALLGEGWGALVENPAVGGWRVSYTHTFATYLVVKAGVVGLAAMLVWLAALRPAATALWRRDPPWALAVLTPLLTAFSVHTSYKYLDTGALLTLMILLAPPQADKTAIETSRRML